VEVGKNINRKKDPTQFLSDEEKLDLSQAIQSAERHTSGEIRVHLQQKCEDEPMQEAQRVFEKLGMTQTEQRNGILFFLSLEDRHFVILGDIGIHEKVKEDFWHVIRDEVLSYFNEGKFLQGLQAGILKCGEKLAKYFPHQKTDQNELTNDISTS